MLNSSRWSPLFCETKSSVYLLTADSSARDARLLLTLEDGINETASLKNSKPNARSSVLLDDMELDSIFASVNHLGSCFSNDTFDLLDVDGVESLLR